MFVVSFINLFVVELIALGYPGDIPVARTLQLIVMVNSGNGVRAEPCDV